MADKVYYIYGLHTGDSQYRYIGRSRNPMRRLSFHRVAAIENDPAPVYDWIREIGIEHVDIDILDGPITSRINAAENNWAYFFRQQNYDLLNEASVGEKASVQLLRCKSKAEVAAFAGGSSGRHQRWHTKRNLYNPNCAYCVAEGQHGRILTYGATKGILATTNREQPESTGTYAYTDAIAMAPEPVVLPVGIYREPVPVPASDTPLPGMQWIDWAAVEMAAVRRSLAYVASYV